MKGPRSTSSGGMLVVYLLWSMAICIIMFGHSSLQKYDCCSEKAQGSRHQGKEINEYVLIIQITILSVSQTNDTLCPDSDDLVGIELMHMKKVPEEDTRSEFETYNSHGGSIMDIPGLDESPAPNHTRRVLVANQLRNLEEWTLDFIRDGVSDTSGVSSGDDYIYLTDNSTLDTYRGRSSPPMTNYVPDSPT